MSRRIKKYIPKWQLGKFYHNKLMAELEEKKRLRDLEPVVEDPMTEQEKLLKLFDDPAWLFDNMLISYEEYLKRKKDGKIQP